jgi:hypothetical protein
MPQVQKISRNNTTQSTCADGSKTVTLHSTVIVQWHPEACKVRLYTGGWNTSTTRNRMNQALNEWDIPAYVSFADHSPMVRLSNGKEIPFKNSEVKFSY